MYSIDIRTRVFATAGVLLSIVLTTLAFSLIVPELFANNYNSVNIHKGIGVSVVAIASIRATVGIFKKGSTKVSIIPNEDTTPPEAR